MKFALISVTKETASGQNLIGMQPLFDSSVLENQISTARKIGVEKVFLLSTHMSGPLLQYVDKLNQQGLSSEIIRTGPELVPYASENDQIIFFGDGMLLDTKFEKRLGDQSGEVIYIVENASEYEDYERIDLGHRWLGVAVLSAARLESLMDIPEDWDIGSALLRTAVQAQVTRVVIADEEVTSGAVAQLKSEMAIEQFTEQKLASSSSEQGGLLDRLVLWPLMRRALKPLWKKSSSAKYLDGFAFSSGLLAGVCAYLQWPVISICLLITSYVATKQRNALSIFSRQTTGFRGPDLIFAVMCMVVSLILVAAMSPQDSISQNIVIVTSLLLLLPLETFSKNNSKLRKFRPDSLLVLLTLLMAASFGQIFIGFYVSLLWTTAYLFLESIVFDSKSGK